MGRPDPTPENNQPSAPPPDKYDYESGSGHPAPPRLETAVPLQAPAPMHTSTSNAPPPSYGSTSAESSQAVAPPPSYQEAMAYPAAAYMPNTFPKPATSMPQPNAGVYPPYPASTPQPNAGGPGIRAPQHPTSIPQPQTAHVVITGGNCPHCLAGQVQSETDLCCLLCLIVLAIFTFPVGLVLLCCIPCTVRSRCSRCHYRVN
ncbi:Protein F11G11.5 [Aphelenchoides avenae]|nr:Protein F11G11.5 [Aphelenchus avenae]